MVDGTNMQLTYMYMLMYGGHCVYEVVDNSIFFSLEICLFFTSFLPIFSTNAFWEVKMALCNSVVSPKCTIAQPPPLCRLSLPQIMAVLFSVTMNI